jgi:hypothetical protein
MNPANRLLTHTATIREHLTSGLDAMLKVNGCTPQFCEVLGEFLSPVIGLVAEMERNVAQMKPLNALRVEFFAEELSNIAETPAQMKLAGELREFAQELSGKEPIREKGRDLER